MLDLTEDLHLTQLIGVMLRNWRFFVVLGNKKSRNNLQKNRLSQGRVLVPLLFNINSNDQPFEKHTVRVMYTDDLCIASQQDIVTAIKTNQIRILEGQE